MLFVFVWRLFAQMTDDDSALTSQGVADCVAQLPVPIWSALLSYYVSGVHSCDVIDNSALQTGTGKL